MRVRSPLLAQSRLFSFPPGTEMFQFPGLASCLARCRGRPRRVAPFGYPRLIGYLPLTAAFRSLSRPSSPPRAKASFMCPSLLSFFLYLEKSPFSRVGPFLLGSLLRRSTSPRPCSGESLFSSVFCCFVLLVIYSSLLTLASLGLSGRSFRLLSPETLALLLPSCQCPLFRVENNGFEPLTPCLQSRCSSQLS